jgi:DnaD/phage-associated family protein
MALFRQVHTEFWQDNFVVELTPEDRYFYLYLITNSRVSQCGIYSFSKKFAAVETGYSSETIDKLLERFVGYGKILYNPEKNEIMILNWYKYNNINNHKNIRICINKELKKIKTQSFIEKFYDLSIELEGCSDEVLKEIFGDLVIGNCSNKLERGEEENKKSEEVFPEDTKLEENAPGEKKAEFKDVIAVFESNIHLPSAIELEKLKDWCEEVECGVVLMAIEEAVLHNARNMSYINTILNNWASSGIKTVLQLQCCRRDRQDRQGKKDEKYKPKVIHPCYREFKDEE